MRYIKYIPVALTSTLLLVFCIILLKWSQNIKSMMVINEDKFYDYTRSLDVIEWYFCDMNCDYSAKRFLKCVAQYSNGRYSRIDITGEDISHMIEHATVIHNCYFSYVAVIGLLVIITPLAYFIKELVRSVAYITPYVPIPVTKDGV